MPDYLLKPFDQELVVKTRAEWERQIVPRAAEILTSHYERILDWAEKYANNAGDKNYYVYGLICNDGSEHACAVLEITHAVPTGPDPWLKVLSVYLEPDLDAGDEADLETAAVRRISDILGYALVESLRLTLHQHPASKLKVYARTDFAKGFFEAIAAAVMRDNQVPGLRLSVHGRWLVFDLPRG